jgi:DNA polymerase-3 subunit epsilon
LREIVLDTETTGFEPAEGHRIVEIGAIELHNHMPTGRTFHHYLNPDRKMPVEAFEVHGLGDDFLRDKPRFGDIGEAFLAFVGADSRLVIHNAAFDMKFLNAELNWAGLQALGHDRALDTVALARRRFPGAPASLDALCRRFGIDNSAREKHGALLDAELLAEVYLELIGGRQPDLVLADASPIVGGVSAESEEWVPGRRALPLPSGLTEAEAQAHAVFVKSLGEKAIWKRFG